MTRSSMRAEHCCLLYSLCPMPFDLPPSLQVEGALLKMILSDTALCALCGRSLLVGLTRLVSIRKSPMDISKFPNQKRAIFRKIKDNSAQQRNWTTLTRNEQFFARSRTIPHNSGIGQPSRCPSGRTRRIAGESNQGIGRRRTVVRRTRNSAD
jgi:hypothetical protein